jgi:uncharacterized protein YktB (UPF0637 family)
MSIQFNPGQREDVAAIKQIFADAYDTIELHIRAITHGNDMIDADRLGTIKRLEAIAKTNLETAQMYAVKAVTR